MSASARSCCWAGAPRSASRASPGRSRTCARSLTHGAAGDHFVKGLLQRGLILVVWVGAVLVESVLEFVEHLPGQGLVPTAEGLLNP